MAGTPTCCGFARCHALSAGQYSLSFCLSSRRADHHRIRTFTRAAVDIGLPERLSAKPEELALSERFFREHFFHTTLAWFRGGDIHKQDDIRDVKAAVIHHIHDLRDYGALFDPKDEIWKSEVGQDAFKLLGPEELLPDSSCVNKGYSGAGFGEGEARMMFPVLAYNV